MVLEVLQARHNVISGSGATRTLNQNESGSTVLFDRAAGIVYTLPAACAVGTHFKFVVTTTVTSNAAKIITGAGTELMVGGIINCDTDSSDAVAIWKSLVATGNVAVSMDGSTKGGIKGDIIEVEKVNSTTWQVTGYTNGTGTVATPFATS